MSYLTNDDIRLRIGDAAYIQLTDDANSGTADETIVNEARAGAQAEADSYLAGRYAIPIDTGAYAESGSLLRSFVIDIAEYRLHNRRPPVPADIVRRHTEAVAWLLRVATRAAHLPGVPERNAAPDADAARFGPDRIFNRDELDDS